MTTNEKQALTLASVHLANTSSLIWKTTELSCFFDSCIIRIKSESMSNHSSNRELTKIKLILKIELKDNICKHIWWKSTQVNSLKFSNKHFNWQKKSHMAHCHGPAAKWIYAKQISTWRMGGNQASKSMKTGLQNNKGQVQRQRKQAPFADR